MVREMIVGVVGVVALSAIFLLFVRHPARPPGACSGCALAGACDRQGAAESGERGAPDRQACYVGGQPEDEDEP